MSTTSVTQQAIWEGKDASYMARIQLAGVDLTQAKTTSVTRNIYDTSSTTPKTAIDTTVLTVASVVFDALQTDDRWTVTDDGYNFRDDIGGAEFPNGGHTYRVEYDFVGSSGELFGAACELPAQEWFG